MAEERFRILVCPEHGPLQANRDEYLAFKCSEATSSITGEGGDRNHAEAIEWIEVVPASLLTAERERSERLREALDGLFGWVSKMPDAALKKGDPRYNWWYNGYLAREVARLLLTHSAPEKDILA